MSPAATRPSGFSQLLSLSDPLSRAVTGPVLCLSGSRLPHGLLLPEEHGFLSRWNKFLCPGKWADSLAPELMVSRASADHPASRSPLLRAPSPAGCLSQSTVDGSCLSQRSKCHTSSCSGPRQLRAQAPFPTRELPAGLQGIPPTRLKMATPPVPPGQRP